MVQWRGVALFFVGAGRRRRLQFVFDVKVKFNDAGAPLDSWAQIEQRVKWWRADVRLRPSTSGFHLLLVLDPPETTKTMSVMFNINKKKPIKVGNKSWSGRLEQSPTGQLFRNYIINFWKQAQDASFLTFLLHWLTVSQSMSSEHCTAPLQWL